MFFHHFVSTLYAGCFEQSNIQGFFKNGRKRNTFKKKLVVFVFCIKWVVHYGALVTTKNERFEALKCSVGLQILTDKASFVLIVELNDETLRIRGFTSKEDHKNPGERETESEREVLKSNTNKRNLQKKGGGGKKNHPSVGSNHVVTGS